MAQVTPPYGTLYYNGLDASAGDLRSWGNEGVASGYTTATDASFADGKCHNVTTAAQTSQLFGSLSECDTNFGNYIELAYGDELRFYVEEESGFIPTTSLVQPAIQCYHNTGSAVGYRLVFSSPKIFIRWFVADNKGAESVTSDYELSASAGTPTYRQIEWTTRRYLDGSDTKLELKGYIGGALQETLTHTVSSGGDQTFKVSLMGQMSTSFADKGGTRNFKVGRIHVSWNNGTISRSDQQFWTTWAPTVVHGYPTGDVTSPDEWTADGDATDNYKNVDDDPYVYTTGAAASSSTTKKELLFSFANVGTLSGLVVPILNYQDQDPGTTTTNPKIQAICKNGGGTYKRLTEQNNVTNTHAGTGYHNSNVFHTDPASAAWTETSVDDNDFGLDKPASGSASAATVSAVWRYVLHGGNQVATAGSLLPQKRRSMRALLIR